MAEQEQHKRSSLLHNDQQALSAKKSRDQAPSPSRVSVVKQEPEEREEGEVSPVVVRATGAVAVEETMDEPQVKLSFAVSLFHCRACGRPLRPPTFKCEAGHLVCGACRGIHGQACDRAGTAIASPDVDVYVRSARLPCANAEFGCESVPVYYQAADHERACHWAPWRCPDPACDAASTSPARLLAHFADRHSWPVTAVSYAKPHRIALPAPAPRGLHFLVAEEDDGRVFLVSSSALGGAASSAVAASLVCVRANGDAATAAGEPRFRCTLWVEDARSGGGGDVARVTFKVASSDLSGGYVSAAEQGTFLAVPSGLLRDTPGDAEMPMPDLMVRIDKVDATGRSGEETPPAADGLEARRKRVLKPNPRFTGPEWNSSQPM